MKIGILQTDSIADVVRPISGGDYPDMFEALFKQAGATFDYAVFDVTSGQFPDSPSDCDGYLITGSKVGVYDGLPWIAQLKHFVLSIHESTIPLIGVCFGHQIIAEAFGGKVEKSPKGWGVGMHYVAINEHLPWMDNTIDQCGLIFSHQDQVTEAPRNAKILASSEFCPVQMFSIDDHILGMQCHPEMNKDHSSVLMRMFCETIGPLACARAATSLNSIPNDGHILGKWMVQFYQTHR